MNKKTLKASLTLALLVTLSQLYAAPALASHDLAVTFNTNPTIVAPGTNGYLMVNLHAIGDTASNVVVSASDWDETVITAEGNWDVTVGSIDNGGTYSVPFEFSIASNAHYGLYQIVFDVSYSGGITVHQTAILEIQQPSYIDVSSITPASINIGQATTVKFNLTNTGSTIYHVLFSWEDPNDLILPVGSDNRVTIPTLPAGNITTVPVTMMASPTLSPGVYPLTISMKFFDDTGTNQTMISTVGIEVSGATTFEIVSSTSTTGATSFTIINAGANKANSVIVSIPQQAGYSVSGSRTASLGNLDPGDYSLASFTLTSSNSSTSFPFNRNGTNFNRNGSMTPPQGQGQMATNRSGFNYRNFTGMNGNGVTIVITYTDAFGARQTVQKQVTISSSTFGGSFGSSSRTRSTTSNGGFGTSQTSSSSNGGLIYIVIGIIGIILIAAIVFIGRKKKLPGLARLFKRRNE